VNKARRTAGLTLDTGALIALDHPASAILMQARLDEAWRRGGSICVPASVIAQAWRGPRQVRLARLIRSRDVDIAVMTLSVARIIGEICADTGHCDVVDVHVALCAREREHAVVTSDTNDLARIDPALRLIRV
jgi:predicted nucleic acid-binding protein